MGRLIPFVRIRACSMDFDAGLINSAAVAIGLGRPLQMAPFMFIRCNRGHQLLPSLHAGRSLYPSLLLPRENLHLSHCRWIGMIDYRQGVSLWLLRVCLAWSCSNSPRVLLVHSISWKLPSATPANIAASYSDGFLRVFDFGRERGGLSAMVRIVPI
jgi:hypothetical protein